MIELIVVTSVMVLLTSSSVFYFFDFTDNRELIIQADILEDDISELNRQVKNFKISDYSLYFSASSNYYTGSINNLWTEDLVTFSVNNFGTGSFSIAWWSPNKTWKYSIYEESKEIITKITPADSNQSYGFDLAKNYEIVGYIGGAPSNTIILKTLSTLDSWIELTAPDSGVFSNKNNIITPLNLELTKWSATYNLELK